MKLTMMVLALVPLVPGAGDDELGACAPCPMPVPVPVSVPVPLPAGWRRSEGLR